MTTLKNRFIAVGNLSECRVDIFPSRLQCKFSLDVDGTIITAAYHVSKRFKPYEYKKTVEMLSLLHPLINGYVYINGIDRYYTLSCGETKLLVTGNIYPSANDNRIWFNAEFIEIQNVNRKNSLQIELSAAYVDDKKFLNIVADSSRLFSLDARIKTPKKNIVYDFTLSYNTGYETAKSQERKRQIVKTRQTNDRLKIITQRETNKALDNFDVEQWLLEWEIVNGE